MPVAGVGYYTGMAGRGPFGGLGNQFINTWDVDPDVALVEKNRMKRFGDIKGALQGNLWQNAMNAGGQSGPGPEITASSVWNPQQVQQQVNAARAANDQALGSQVQTQQRQLAGRGFGAQSPLAMALQQGATNQNQAQNATAEREIRLGAAGANAGQLLKAQMARENQWSSRMDEDIRRRIPYLQQQNALISALAGLA